MQKVEIEFLRKRNLRYRILKSANQYYLLDADTPLLIVYFFPVLTYFVPHRCYPITQTEYQQLSNSPEMNDRIREVFSRYGFRYSLGSGLLAMLLGIGFNVNQYLYFSAGMFNYILAIFIGFMVIGLRIWMTQAYKLPDSYYKRSYRKIWIFPRFVKRLLLFVFSYLVILAVCTAIIYAFLTAQVDNYIVHINLLTLPTLCLCAGNFIFLAPNKYWIKLQN